MSDIKMLNVNGHIEVYSGRGEFLFSADNLAEAQQDLEFFLAA